MERIEFTLNGERRTLTRSQVIKAMKSQTPGRIQTYVVDIEGVDFPVKQVLAQSLQVPVTSFVSTRAQDLLAKLGFEVTNLELEDLPDLEDELLAGSVRQLALDLAVQLHARRPSDDTQILKTAVRFEEWLSR